MSVVVDASVALKWVLTEPGSDDAAALRDQELVAPSLWLLEAASALWKRARRGELTDEEAETRLAALRRAPVTMAPIEDHLPTALQWALRLAHPVYDCLYLAVALREDAWVVTADERFIQATARDPSLNGRVRRLGAEG